MIAALPGPVLSVTPELIRELDGREAVYRLWTLFTKCKGSLENGRRLENISWRLWYRDILGSSPSWQHQRDHPSLATSEKPDLLTEKPYHPPTPIETAVVSAPANADVSDLQLSSSAGPAQDPLATSLTKNHETDCVRKTLRPLPVGRIICDMLPSPLSPPLLPVGSPSFASISITASTGFTVISRSPRSEPFAQSQINNPRLSPSGVPLLPLLPLLPLSEQFVTVEPQFTSPSQLPTPGVEEDESTPFGSATLRLQQQPTLRAPIPILSTSSITPPPSTDNGHIAPVTALLRLEDDPLASASSTSELPHTPGVTPVVPVVATPPRLVVVNPTPGPTPHPTPPATPLSFLSSSDPGKPRTHGQFLAPPSISRRAPSNPIPAPVFDRIVPTDVVDESAFNKTSRAQPGGEDDQPPIVVDESALSTLRSRSAIHDITSGITAQTASRTQPPLSSQADKSNNNGPSSSASSSISRSSRLTSPPTTQDPAWVEPRPSEDVEREEAEDTTTTSTATSQPSHHNPHRLSLSSASTTSTTGTNTSDTSSSQISLGATSVNTDSSDSNDILKVTDGREQLNLKQLASQGPRLPHSGTAMMMMMMGPPASLSSSSKSEEHTLVASPSPISPTITAAQQQAVLSTSVNSVKSSKSAKSVVSNPGRTTRNGKLGGAPGLIRRASSGAAAVAGSGMGRSRRAVVGGAGGGGNRRGASSDTSRSRSRETGKGVAAAAGALAAAMGMAMTTGGGVVATATATTSSGGNRKKVGGGAVGKGARAAALKRTSSKAAALTRTLSHEDVMEVTEDDDDGEEVEVDEDEELGTGKQAPPSATTTVAAAAAAAVADHQRKAAEPPHTKAKFKFGSVSDDGSAAAAKSMGSGTEISSRAPGSVLVANHMVDPNSTVRQGAVNQIDRKGKGREVDPQQVQQQLEELESRKVVVDKQRQRKEAEAVARARARESLGAPLLPQQGKRTILLTSESDYTDTDEESWESEDVSEEKDTKAESSKAPTAQPSTRQASHPEVRQTVQPTQQHPPAPQQRPALHRTQSNASAHHRHTRREMQHIQQRREAQLRVQKAALQLQKEEEERQRQKEMFAKRPTASFQNLANARTQSFGLLTQLMNPDPSIFPPNHPYRRGHSSGEIQRLGGLTMTSGPPAPHPAQQPPVEQIQRRQEAPPQQPLPREQQQLAQHPPPQQQQRQPQAPPPVGQGREPGPPQQQPQQQRQPRAPPPTRLAQEPGAPPPQQQKPTQRPGQDSAVPPSPVRSERRQPPTTNPVAALALRGMRGLGLPFSKTGTAGPVASQVVVASVKPKAGVAPPGHARTVSGSGGQRQKGPLPGQEMDTDSEDEAEESNNGVQLSQSVAQHRLQVFAARRGIVQATNPLPPQQETDEVPNWAREQQQQQAQAGPSHQQQQPQQPPGPIPMMHPYNLPINAMPLTPRTTRLQMLRNEMPESLRRQLLWERQQAGVPIRRTTSTGGGGGGAGRGNVLGGLKPLTTTPSMVQLRPKGSTNQDQLKGSGDRERRASGGKEAEDDMAEKRRKAMARNRSWADTYHTSGW
ncbi:hypothetical protein MD484_g3038, partial [Candolleomyces efflorescens]